MAQTDLETLRDYSVMTAASAAAGPAGTRSYAAVSSAAASAAGGNTNYTITRTVADWGDPVAGQAQAQASLREVRVKVEWEDRAGSGQFVQLDSFIARADPALGASLAIAATSSFGNAVSSPVTTAPYRPSTV